MKVSGPSREELPRRQNQWGRFGADAVHDDVKAGTKQLRGSVREVVGVQLGLFAPIEPLHPRRDRFEVAEDVDVRVAGIRRRYEAGRRRGWYRWQADGGTGLVHVR